ncbi:MAG: preprotein translocase subunit SecG, partial [Pseudohongiellaceae bacterium]
MESLIVAIHIVVALAIVGLVLIQQGKGADMGASFGSGASQTIFGSAGSGNVLT